MHPRGRFGKDKEGKEECQGFPSGCRHGGGESTEFLGEGRHACDAEVATGTENDKTEGAARGLGAEKYDAIVELHGEKAVGKKDKGAKAVGVEDEFVVAGVVFPQGVLLDVYYGRIDRQGHGNENYPQRMEGGGYFDVGLDEEDEAQGKEGDDHVVFDLREGRSEREREGGRKYVRQLCA
jgi:hypothetical protein|eukprot:evm.model.NODE_19310_length_24751_cov_15.882955.9